MEYVFKIATTEEEFKQIHQLNYRTFVEEIPQHNQNEEGILIDSFHNENTYLICLKEEKLIGMIAIRDNRPFSLDKKLGKVENHLPFKPVNPCEIRLLSVEPAYRKGNVFLGLAQCLGRYCQKNGYDCVLISGTTRQLKLYRHIGFQPFGPLVGTEGALYQPMVLMRDSFEHSVAGQFPIEMNYFIPGTVSINDAVTNAFMKKPSPHRSPYFSLLINEVKKKICKLTNAKYVQILLGTGTLANDVVANQLNGKGLILVNGEFGKRLVDHAKRSSLQFDVLEKDWGTPFVPLEITKQIETNSYEWLWTVHCETSTGMLQDLSFFKEICKKYKLKLCLDSNSSIGANEIDLTNVYLATGVSGKAIGSYNGLSFVFHQHEVSTNSDIPRYLDLGSYFVNDSIPYTHSSNLISALNIALKNYEEEAVFQYIHTQAQHAYEFFEKHNIPVLTEKHETSNTIITIPLPRSINSKTFGNNMLLNGYYLHYESEYLVQRNWVQVSFINKNEGEVLNNMLEMFLIQYKE
ncbi:GNAT family N-acetyltransferase [Metabacillus fastidiosus]|uniref:aminotransferase class V-fold PLP-dependent enzyme n=1 Tax=Metabacillus fastidiosus TaxID=1458 RepID=UPI003D277BAF